MPSPFKNIGLFGANGVVGRPIFEALIRCQEPVFTVIAFVSPESNFRLPESANVNTIVQHVDLNRVSMDELAEILSHHKIDVTISALGGEIIKKQALIQDASAKAKIKRFYPSEFGMNQVAWLPGGDPYLHPIWATKMKCLQDAIKHPAIKNGRMSYTVIGCGELWDCPVEPLLCPWLETDKEFIKDRYSIQCVGDPHAKMDYSSRTDIAKFCVATLIHPERSENKILGFRSDHISYTEIASLLAEYSGKSASVNVTSIDDMRMIIKDPSLAPKELQRGSTFPLSFLMVLRYVQGQGVFWRPPGLLHNDLFPEVKPVPMRDYFKGFFDK